MLDFPQCPVVDNHYHVLEPEKKIIEFIWLAREFFHGIADSPIVGVAKAKIWGATTDLLHHFPHMGVVLTAVCQLAKLFGCKPTLEAVTVERNRRTADVGLAAKTAKIALGEVLVNAVRLGFMAERDAERTGRMALHDNGARMYGPNPQSFPNQYVGEGRKKCL